MKSGTITNNGEVACAQCEKKLGKENDTIVNFCDNCGNALNFQAMKFSEMQLNEERSIVAKEIKQRLLNGEDINAVLNDYI